MITVEKWEAFLATKFDVVIPPCNCGCGTPEKNLSMDVAQMWDTYQALADVVGFYKALEDGYCEIPAQDGTVIKVTKVGNR